MWKRTDALFFVIPAKAGIQLFDVDDQPAPQLDSRLRGNDEVGDVT
jgi:hypothetical protein